MPGTYKIIREKGFWCVGRLLCVNSDGEHIYQRISNYYSYVGWAKAFCRRMQIKPLNYKHFSSEN